MRTIRHFLACTGLGLGVVLAPAAAFAQTPAPAAAPLSAPKPGNPDAPPGVRNLLTLFLILGIVLAAAFIPSKRSHQD